MELKEYNKMQIWLMVDKYKHIPNCQEIKYFIKIYWAKISELVSELEPGCSSCEEIKQKIKIILKIN